MFPSIYLTTLTWRSPVYTRVLYFNLVFPSIYLTTLTWCSPVHLILYPTSIPPSLLNTLSLSPPPPPLSLSSPSLSLSRSLSTNFSLFSVPSNEAWQMPQAKPPCLPGPSFVIKRPHTCWQYLQSPLSCLPDGSRVAEVTWYLHVTHT